MLSATNAPPGCGSIQAEVYFSSKYRPLEQSTDSIIDQLLLTCADVISSMRRIVFFSAVRSPSSMRM